VRAPFVLASRSPRRLALLAAAGLAPEVRAADVDETPLAGELPLGCALRVAALKAAAVVDDRPVLAADTVVALDGAILGKPSPADAAAMLARLSGREHAVHTAVVVAAGPPGARRAVSEVVTTSVLFRALSPAEIERYAASGEGLDKAGGYGIQGLGGALVDRVVGSYTAVVGLPLAETLRLLAMAGVR
jgi:septum formation protein